jgi:hypothetical protein
MAKRRVFISYHHEGEQRVVDDFCKKFSDRYDVFIEMPHHPGDTLDDWRSVICRMRGDAADERLEHFIESLRMAGWR